MMIDVLKEQRKALKAETPPDNTYDQMLRYVKMELLDERIKQLSDRLARQVRVEAEEWLAGIIQNSQQGTT